jgi:hypothetical protein
LQALIQAAIFVGLMPVSRITIREILVHLTSFLRTKATVGLISLMWAALSINAAEQMTVPGHVPAAVAQLKPLGDLPGTNQLRLVVGLPFHNQAQLDQLLAELNDPASTTYHRWLTTDEFGRQFGPTEADYRKVVEFVRGRGLQVAGLCSNRMLVDVTAPVSEVENAFKVKLRRYPHPTEPREFYAPDTEPAVDTNVPILHISGLDNFTLPHRLGGFKLLSLATNNGVTADYTGSAPGGYFMGNDFRAAYVPGVTNTGAGQYIAIADVGGQYYPNDVYMYETNAGLSTNIVVTNIVATESAYWTNALTGSSTDDGEEALDICMAMSMAPGATILNYEGGGDDVFNRIAEDNRARQITLSYGFGIDPNTIQSFQEFIAQGQALSQASGDGDADLNGGTGLTGNPYATIVGGTTLTTSGAGGPWSSETAWNWNNNGGSGGGISGYGIPSWQEGVATVVNQGSAVYRNYPDVAMPADGVFLISKNGTSVGSVGGTSCASPLWAGFMALANQEAASLHNSAVGFPNPAIYALGKGPYAAYTNCFHDIVTGNNVNSQNPTRFYATNGYDLCTGWGTPRGSNAMAALAGSATSDFMFYTSQGAFAMVRGSVATTTITVAGMNRFAGTVNFSVSGLPAGVTATISPASTTSSSLLKLTVGNAALIGTYLINLTGTSGALTHVVSLSVAVVAPVPGATQLNLSSYYNRYGIWTDGNSLGAGLDGGGYAYSANLLGTAPGWNGIAFTLGPANALDAVSCTGQTITLPAGNFNSLQLLATAVDGNQPAQTFTVTYTDNSTATFTQSLSDWANPQNYAGESVLVSMSYRDTSGGGRDPYTTVRLYGYNFTLNQTKTVKSLTLPNDGDVVILAAAVANDWVTAGIASYYNRAGMYSDGATFTNPATGGMDGVGYAYSASLLTGSQVWSNNLFAFGPANATNVVSATNQVIPLPAGNYAALQMLATGVNGDQTVQDFLVKYTDGSGTYFVQNLSDWYSPQGYSGESKAMTMGHRNKSDGTADSRTFYLYGYSFKLNAAKVLQSVTLPNNSNVIVTAISLVPNWPPTFGVTPFTEPGVTAGQSYSVNIATNASDLNGDALTFGKVSGPAWLGVSSGGALSGTPLSANVGANSFVVSVSDPAGLSNTATLNLTVQPAPPIVAGISNSASALSLNWSGGVGPYQLQMSTNLAAPNWVNVGSPVSSTTVSLSPGGPAVFYRVVGQ